MSELNQFPVLSLTPEAPEVTAPAPAEPVKSIQETPAQPATPQQAPRMDQSQLTEAEKKAIEDFIGKLDVTNPDHVLLFGADAQKRIADFSDSALDAVKTQDTGEVGNMLVNLVAELKGFQKVFLQAGESQRITIRLDDKAFRYFNTSTGRWERKKPCAAIFLLRDYNQIHQKSC